MAFTFGTAVENSATATATTIVSPSITPGADGLLVAFVCCESQTITVTMTDSQGGSWTEVGTVVASAEPFQMRMFYSVASAAVARTVTATFSSTITFRGIVVGSWTGNRATTPLDVQNGSTQATPGTGANGVTTGTATPSRQPCQIIGLAFSYLGTTVTAGTGFTNRGGFWTPILGAANARLEDQALTSTAAVAATWTAGGNNRHYSKMGIFLEPDAGDGGGGRRRPGIVLGGQLGQGGIRVFQ